MLTLINVGFIWLIASVTLTAVFSVVRTYQKGKAAHA